VRISNGIRAKYGNRAVTAASWIKLGCSQPSLLRFFTRWWRLRSSASFSLSHPISWMTFEAIEWLQTHLKKSHVLFEWGSGGSTLFFAERVAHLTSIEHDVDWYKVTQDAINVQGRTNVEYKLILPEALISDEPIKQIYLSTDPRYHGRHFRAYCSIIDALPNSSFDLISVDGRARNGCVFHAHTKVKPGGVLVLDNAERPTYDEGKRLLSSWKRLDFYGPGPYSSTFWLTTIYLRPSEDSH
jgi:hypothetical protein